MRRVVLQDRLDLVDDRVNLIGVLEPHSASFVLHDFVNWAAHVDIHDIGFGARPLKRYMQKHVETLAAKCILEDKVKEGDKIEIVLKNGELDAEVKS